MSLKHGLEKLGPMDGKSEKDFVDAIGRKPVSISDQPGGNRLLQRRSGRYRIQRIAVLFVGITHKFVKVSSRYPSDRAI
jgi:hypothetical protein